MEILEQIAKQNNHLESLRASVIRPTLKQLHPNMEGFNSPQTFGVYRHTGGDAIGVVGNQYIPQDLIMFIDSIEQSVAQCSNLDLSKLAYKEFKGGAKVSFTLPIKTHKLDTKQVGDIIETYLTFNTGFDGLTKTSIGFHTKRIVCLNGATSQKTELALSFKNTKGNQGKAQIFCNEIMETIEKSSDYINELNELAKIKITKAQQDKFISDLTGYSMAEYNDLNTSKRNILDRINRSIGLEAQTLDLNAFALLQGATRYITHEIGKGNEFAYRFDNAKNLNDKAHKLVYELN